MSSIIQGYEYDIFISYRQKDNRYDGWVTEFVSNLKMELEATFKEEVSVYFDINPHDGLLETHEVDASLKQKLKCLIFIPIISQTYCDPKSFAWQNEFCEFNRLAKEDQLGKSVRLAGGNVAGRILPVKIHELDPEDISLIETELGGSLRGIEFIYKSAGVNRPLRANEDHPRENLNKTYYRDQINKVANAVKDIIISIRNKADGSSSSKSLNTESVRLSFRKKLAGRNILRAGLVYILTSLLLWKVIVISSGLLNMTETVVKVVTLILIVLFPVGILLAWLYEKSPEGFIRTSSANALENSYSDNQKKPFTSVTFITILILSLASLFLLFPQMRYVRSTNGMDAVEKSIAVLPFINDSPDEENAYFINGIMDEILNNLQKIKDFSVRSRTSTEQFKGANKPTLPEIAKKLNVNYIVEGSGQKYGNTFRLNVQLIAVSNEKHLWGGTYEQEIKETKDIFSIQSQIAQAIATKLQASITPEEKRQIEKTSTINLTAYDFYQRGQSELDKYKWPDFSSDALKRAEVLFHKALRYDSTYALAYFGLAQILWIQSDGSRNNNFSENEVIKAYVDSMMIFADFALTYDDHLEGAYIIRGVHYSHYGNLKKSIEEFDNVIRINPNNPQAYIWKGRIYEGSDIIKSLENYQKGALLFHGLELNELLKAIGNEYYQAGFPDTGKDFLLKALKLDGDSVGYSDNKMRNTLGMTGDFKKLIEYFEMRRLADSTNNFYLLDLGYCNTNVGNYKESLKYFKQYLSKIKFSELNNPKMEIYIGYSYLQNGFRKEAEYFFNRQIESYNKVNSYLDPGANHGNYGLATIYACRGDKVKAYENLNMLLQNPTLGLNLLNQLKFDPMLSSIRNEPQFQNILREAESKYEITHEGVRKMQEAQGEKL